MGIRTTTSRRWITDHQLQVTVSIRCWMAILTALFDALSAADKQSRLRPIATSRAGDDAVEEPPLWERRLMTCVRRSTWLLRYWLRRGSTRRVATLSKLAALAGCRGRAVRAARRRFFEALSRHHVTACAAGAVALIGTVSFRARGAPVMAGCVCTVGDRSHLTSGHRAESLPALTADCRRMHGIWRVGVATLPGQQQTKGPHHRRDISDCAHLTMPAAARQVPRWCVPTSPRLLPRLADKSTQWFAYIPDAAV